MKSVDLLHRAATIVGGDRQNAYGPPERSFCQIAAMWSAYLGVEVSARDVAWMMSLLKIARASHGVPNEDTAIDAAAYAALAGELEA